MPAASHVVEDDSMQDQLIQAALAAARKCLATRFKGASHLFVAGSILRGISKPAAPAWG